MEEEVILKLNKNDVAQYVSKNKTAVLQFCIAGNDYISGRCLYFNGLFNNSLTSFAQAFEKIFKAIICIETGKKSQNANNHSVLKLSYELKGISKNKYERLEYYEDLFKKLDSFYTMRYPGSLKPGQGLSFGTEELHQIDDLWCSLLENISFPTEVKYRLEFFSSIFEVGFIKHFSHPHWVKHSNNALTPKWEEMRRTYEAVKAHLYPNI